MADNDNLRAEVRALRDIAGELLCWFEDDAMEDVERYRVTRHHEVFCDSRRWRVNRIAELRALLAHTGGRNDG